MCLKMSSRGGISIGILLDQTTGTWMSHQATLRHITHPSIRPPHTITAADQLKLTAVPITKVNIMVPNLQYPQ